MKLPIALVENSKRWNLLKSIISHLESKEVKKALARNGIKPVGKAIELKIVLSMFYR